MWWRVAAVSKMSLDDFSVPLPCHAVAVMLHLLIFWLDERLACNCDAFAYKIQEYLFGLASNHSHKYSHLEDTSTARAASPQQHNKNYKYNANCSSIRNELLLSRLYSTRRLQSSRLYVSIYSVCVWVCVRRNTVIQSAETKGHDDDDDDNVFLFYAKHASHHRA